MAKVSLFDNDNSFWSFLILIYNLAYAGFLWFITSLPIITIGASTTALYSYAFSVVENRDGYVGKTFFNSFRKNFVKATMLWIGMLIIFCFLFFDAYLASSGTNIISKIIFFMIIAVLIILAVLAMHDKLDSMAVYNNYKKNGAEYHLTHIDGTVRVIMDNKRTTPLATPKKVAAQSPISLKTLNFLHAFFIVDKEGVLEMNVLYFIDTEDLYNIQKLYDLFLHKKDTSTNILSCRAKYKKMILRLYKNLFAAWKPEQIQKIIVQSNQLTEKLIHTYGDFTQSLWYNTIDYVDQILLQDIASSMSQNTYFQKD